MKKLLAILVTLALLLCGTTALTEETAGTSINCLIEQGSYVIQVDAGDDMGWIADDISQDDSVVKLGYADILEGTFVVRYDPVGNGDVTVGVRHYTGIACDEVHTFDLRVENGAVVESTGGSYTASPNPIELTPYLVGGWDTEDNVSNMIIMQNPGGHAWDVEITFGEGQDRMLFMTTVYYDCDLDSFVYDEGKYWAFSDEIYELGEADVTGTMGSFTFAGDEADHQLVWYDDQRPEETVTFHCQPSEYTYYPEIEAYTGEWVSGDYTLLIVHSDDDYNVMNCIVTQMTGEHEGIRWIYDSCSYDDVGQALTSLEIGMKFTFEQDDQDDLVSNEEFYTDGAAAFKLNDDDTLTWTDFKETPGENELVFERVSTSGEAEKSSIDYLALVNKLNPLPEGWEDALETVHITNSVGDDVEVEKEAYAAYELLRADLLENDGIEIELDSARRSVAAQQDIMDRFIEKYGADYAAKTVAQPGYSEHHTGLALDLYFRLDGKDIYYNEDMVQYPEIWEKIHAKLADYGFILRYLEGKEHITGYGYEPWHIRYVGSTEIAREIMSQPGMTLEAYLGAVNDTDLAIDYGESTLFTEDELEEAAVQIKCKFASFEGCELHALRYAGDVCNTEENLAWLNELGDGNYIQVVEFLSDFHSPVEGGGAWEEDTEYTDWQWWLARTEGGGWDLLTWGY